MVTTSPLVAQLEFSVRIRERRRELELDARTVSSRMGFSRNYYSAVENNRAKLADDRLPELAEILEFDEETAAELAGLLTASRGTGWWDAYARFVDPAALELWALEDGAVEIDIFESNVVTGLLQTEEYARAIIRADPTISASDERRYVSARMKRQERLVPEGDLKLRVVLSEAALYQEIGGVATLRRQLGHLLDLVSSPSPQVEVRIAPFAGSLSVAYSTIYVMQLGSPFVTRAAWGDGAAVWGADGGSDEVEELALLLGRAREASFGVEQSTAYLAERVASLALD